MILSEQDSEFVALEIPEEVTLWNSEKMFLPKRVKNLFDIWRHFDETIAESNLVFDHYAGGDVIDVGSYQGWYAFLLAPKARPGTKFILCEPDPRVVPTLYKNVSVLSDVFPKVRFIVIPFPISDGKFCNVTFPTGIEGHPQFNSEVTNTGKSQLLTDPSCTVDELAKIFNLTPSFLKIDVEGAENAVLQGAQAVLSTPGMSLFLEIHPQWLPIGVDGDAIEKEVMGHGFLNKKSTPSMDDLSSRALFTKS